MGRDNTREIIRESKTSANLVKNRIIKEPMLYWACACELVSACLFHKKDIDLILNYNVKTVSEGDARYDNKGVF